MATDSKDALVEPLLPAEAAEVTSDARQRSEASDEEPWLRWLSPIAQKAVALVALLCGVLAWATLGGMLLLLECVPPLSRAAWRAQTAAIPFLLFYLLQWSFGKNPPLRSINGRRFAPALFFASVGFAGVGALWIWSMSHTSLAQSYLLSNTHGLMLVIMDLVLRRPLSLLEIGGTAVGFAGAGLTLLDSDGVSGDGGESSLAGSLAAFLSAVCLIVYFKCQQVATASAPMFMVMMPITLFNAVAASMLASLAEGATLDRDVCTGLFGWATQQWWWMALYLIIPVGAMGIVGYTIALKLLPALVVSVAMLLEPVLGVLFGLAIGVNGVPGAWTWAGGAIMVAGTVAVTLGAHRRQVARVDLQT